MSYTLDPASPFFDVLASISEREYRPGNTVTFLGEVDLTVIERLRARAPHDQKPSYTAFVAKAVALALREFPYANRRLIRRWWLPFSGRCLQTFDGCDVAIASEVHVPGAEVAAFMDVLRNADRLSLGEISAWLRELSACDTSNNPQWRAFHGIITRLPSSLAILLIRMAAWFPSLWANHCGGSVMISSPAKYGVDCVLGTWRYPLGVSFGLVKRRPVVRGDQIVAAPTFLLTLNFDRRVMAGGPAARFFKRIVDLLEHAETEMAAYLPPQEASAIAMPLEEQRADTFCAPESVCVSV